MDAETVAILFFLVTLAVLAGYAFLPRRRHYQLDPNVPVPASASSGVLSRVKMIHVITTVFLVASLWIILSSRYDEDVQKWAFGSMGSILGFWLRPPD